MPAVSVIIPVYNTRPYLEVCLGSLGRQTLNDIEIVCIDDGSTDGSLALLQEYAARDPRIHVIAQGLHQGTSTARNVGLAAARGEFIGFIDSDDYVDIHYFEHLYATAVSTGADIVKGSYYKENYTERLAEEEYNKKIDKHKYYFSINFTTALYRHSLIKANAISFPEGTANYEDVFFLIQAVYYANTVKTIRGTYYHYVAREGSSSRRQCDSTYIRNILLSSEKIINFINTVDINHTYYTHIFYQILQTILYKSGELQNLSDDIITAMANIVRSHKFLRQSSQNIAPISSIQNNSLKLFQRLLLSRRYSSIRYGKEENKESAVAEYYRNCTADMTVCLYTNELRPGEAELQLVTLARGLARAGVNVYVLCHSLGEGSGHYHSLLGEAGVPVLEIQERKQFLAFGATAAKKKAPLFHEVRSLQTNHMAVLNLAGALTMLSPDILHCYLDGPNCIGGSAGAIASVPGIVFSCRSAEPTTAGRAHADWARHIYTFLLSLPNTLMEANSNACAASYANWLGCPLRAIALNPDGVEITHFVSPPETRDTLRSALGLDARTPVVLSLTRLHPDKLLGDTLAVCMALHDHIPSAHLLLVGDDMEENAQIRYMIQERSLEECVHLLDVREDVAALLATVDVFLYTSRVEGFPNAIMEAMNAGLPVVAYNIGEIPEVVRHGEDGFLHPVGDIASIAESLTRLLGNHALRKKMGANARERIRDNFTADKLVERTVEAYTALLKRERNVACA